MDVGLTRSIGFTPPGIERIPPADLPTRAGDRPQTDGAADRMIPADAGTLSKADLLARLTARAGAPGQQTDDAASRESPVLRDAPERNVQRFMDTLAGPLRTLLEGEQLSEADRNALEEAVSRLESGTTFPEATIDIEQLQKEMEAAFEQFYTSLKRIFRIGDAPQEEGAAPEDMGAVRFGAESDPRPAAAAVNDGRPPRSVDALSPEAAPPSVDEDGVQGGELYRRLAAFYAEEAAWPADDMPSLNARG